ncbi:MAG: hypothetical protein CFE24_03780 [Flavobacterium sp. BFFFF2]|nr:MAG: hypothetical protein CFE24_03780 [Flavobacterium sp. BFFFF2]
MEIREVDVSTYKSYLKSTSHVFNSVEFTELNSDKCDQVFYLLFKSEKVCCGISVGIRNGNVLSPFSAPFGGFEAIQPDVYVKQLIEATQLLQSWTIQKGFHSLKITLPPTIYGNDWISKQVAAFSETRLDVECIDINYHINTFQSTGQYQDSLRRNARKNLNRALASDLFFEKVSSERYEMVYEIIANNRAQRVFPLRLSFEQIQQTIQVVNASFFLVSHLQTPIASALVFEVSPTIHQVVYWGDLLEFSQFKPMNFLSFKLFDYFSVQGIHLLDIGPSTEHGKLNIGLGDFKESIGCKLSEKYTFCKKFN